MKTNFLKLGIVTLLLTLESCKDVKKPKQKLRWLKKK